MATINAMDVRNLGMGAFDLRQPTLLPTTLMPGLRFASSQPTAAYLQGVYLYVGVMQEVY